MSVVVNTVAGGKQRSISLVSGDSSWVTIYNDLPVGSHEIEIKLAEENNAIGTIKFYDESAISTIMSQSGFTESPKETLNGTYCIGKRTPQSIISTEYIFALQRNNATELDVCWISGSDCTLHFICTTFSTVHSTASGDAFMSSILPPLIGGFNFSCSFPPNGLLFTHSSVWTRFLIFPCPSNLKILAQSMSIVCESNSDFAVRAINPQNNTVIHAGTTFAATSTIVSVVLLPLEQLTTNVNIVELQLQLHTTPSLLAGTERYARLHSVLTH